MSVGPRRLIGSGLPAAVHADPRAPAADPDEDVDPDVIVDRDDDAPQEQSGEDLEDLESRRPDPPFHTPKP